MLKRSLACGIWRSPYSPAQCARGARKVSDIRTDGNAVYWVESRPEENGRCVIIRWDPSGSIQECITPEYSVRSRVNEYGGGAYAIEAGELFFSHAVDQRLYHTNSRTLPFAVSQISSCCYGDLEVDSVRRRIICVQEQQGLTGVFQSLVAVNYDYPFLIRYLAQGCDFYASPRLNSTGTRLAWISWNHPSLPWDSTRLWVAGVTGEGHVGDPICVAGDEHESVLYPQWRDEESLVFISDRSGWWNLYAYERGKVFPLLAREEEFSAPPWVLGLRHYAVSSRGDIVYSSHTNGIWHVGVIGRDASVRELSTLFAEVNSIAVTGEHAAFIAAESDRPAGVYSWDLSRRHSTRIYPRTQRRARADVLSRVAMYDVPLADGTASHALFYPPRNSGCRIPAGESPPLIMNVHGGPTAHVGPAFNEQVQFWTSRGFAYAEINYRGSTGFGRAYRDMLWRQWGVIDVEDCRAAARFFAAAGLVDPQRIIIRGRSAGGFTALNAVRQSNLFAAGTVYYGVSDLITLLAQTHRFESHYLDWLIGIYPLEKNVYHERSPLAHCDEIECPLLFFQGQADPVVPASQTQRMVVRLRDRGVPVTLRVFPDEAHGFRRAETIACCLETEWRFYCRVFRLPEPDDHVGNDP